MEVQCPLRCRMGEGPLFTAGWERTFQPHSASTDTTLAENGRCVLFVFCTWLPLTLPGVALLLPRGSEILDSPLGLLWYHLAGKGGIPLYLFWDGILSSSFSLLTWGTVFFVFFLFFFSGLYGWLRAIIVEKLLSYLFLGPLNGERNLSFRVLLLFCTTGISISGFSITQIHQTNKEKKARSIPPCRFLDPYVSRQSDFLISTFQGFITFVLYITFRGGIYI